MNVTLLNGTLAGDATAEAVYDLLLTELAARGHTVTTFVLRDIEITPCTGCFGCWMRTPGRCVLPKGGHDIAKAVVRSELTILLTPIIFGGYSSELKKALDHLIMNILPFFTKVAGETHHVPRYEEPPNLLALGALPAMDGESERIFRALVERNAINFYAETHAVGIFTPAQLENGARAELTRLLDHMEAA